MNRKLSRRTVLQGATAGAATGFFVSGTAPRAADSPNERLRIAGVGATGRAGADIAGVASQDIVAIADVDQQLLEKGAARFPGARKYADFRDMLDREADRIDAVVVGTPDHTHAPASAMALRLKKHVYCEKPLTHTVYEARVLADLAEEHKLVTQMGTQIHAGDNYRRVVELVRAGAIGKVREAHVWASAVYTDGKFTTNTQAPAHLDWDRWLGPAVKRPYSEGVHPFNWRRFWDYGTGTLGDFGCHYMDLAHWALDLMNPVRVSASGPPVDAVTTPRYCLATYDYPARGTHPPLRLFWYDSGKKPPQLDALLKEDPRDQNGKPMGTGGGQLFVGDDGMILANYGQRCLLPKDRFADYKAPDPSIPKSIGHHNEWVHAIKNGGTTTCNFRYSGALTESVLLGTVAYRTGQTLEWDAANLKVTNSSAAQSLIHKEYRKGWTL